MRNVRRFGLTRRIEERCHEWHGSARKIWAFTFIIYRVDKKWTKRKMHCRRKADEVLTTVERRENVKFGQIIVICNGCLQYGTLYHWIQTYSAIYEHSDGCRCRRFSIIIIITIVNSWTSHEVSSGSECFWMFYQRNSINKGQSVEDNMWFYGTKPPMTPIITRHAFSEKQSVRVRFTMKSPRVDTGATAKF